MAASILAMRIPQATRMCDSAGASDLTSARYAVTPDRQGTLSQWAAARGNEMPRVGVVDAALLDKVLAAVAREGWQMASLPQRLAEF
jgi:hypothetical protein